MKTKAQVRYNNRWYKYLEMKVTEEFKSIKRYNIQNKILLVYLHLIKIERKKIFTSQRNCHEKRRNINRLKNSSKLKKKNHEIVKSFNELYVLFIEINRKGMSILGELVSYMGHGNTSTKETLNHNKIKNKLFSDNRFAS